MKKYLAVLLTCLMFSSAAVACTPNENDNPADMTTAPSVTTNAPTSSETTDPTKDAEGYLLDSLPADLNFGGETIGVLNWNSEKPEFEITEITGDIVNDAIYKRNETVENRLGITFEWHEQKGDNPNRAAYLQFAQNSYNAGEKAYDIYATYSRTAGMLAINGLCYNLNHVDYLDFEKPWWPERMLDTCTIGDKLFFISGDISTNLIHLTYGLYYNKDILAEYQLPDPTELVLNKTWTQDKLIEMSSNIYKDLNGNSTVDKDDQLGFTTIYFGCDAFYTGSGLRLIEGDNDLTLKVSPDFTSEKAISMVEKLGAWMATDDTYKESDFEQPFINGRALFCQNRLYMAERFLRDADFSYGVLPTPLYDENQENYISVVGNPYTNYCIAADSENPDMVGAVIEAMCSAAYRMTTPALFETNMKVKYSEDDITAQMFDIVHDTIDFDLGRIFSNDLNYMSEMPSNAICNGQPWASMASKYAKMLTSQLNKIVEKMEALE